MKILSYCHILLFASISMVHPQTRCDKPIAVCYDFVKSLVSKDTVLFYSCIIADSVCNNLNNEYPLDRKVKPNEVHVILFLKYAPWKIMPASLANIRKDSLAVKSFGVEVLQSDSNIVQLFVSWARDKNERKNNRLNLFLGQDKYSHWQIVHIRFNE